MLEVGDFENYNQNSERNIDRPTDPWSVWLDIIQPEISRDLSSPFVPFRYDDSIEDSTDQTHSPTI